jgi:hypothetical protein
LAWHGWAGRGAAGHGRFVSTPSPPPGFLRAIKSTTADALGACFQLSYPEQDPEGGMRRPYVTLSYPVERAHYPGVWTDFEVSLLQTVGLDHTETDALGNALTRWRFQGYATFTVVSINNNENDMIWDELVALTAWAAQSDYPSPFRQAVESSPLVATTWTYDTVEMRGGGASPGTPWGTDDVIYERGMALKVVGEFTTSPITMAIVPLAEIVVIGQETIEGNPEGNPFTLTIT